MILDIKNCYVGDASVSRLYMGTSLVYDSSHPDIPLKYIANGPDGGTERAAVWYDTGVALQSSFDPKVEIKMEAHAHEQSWPIGAINTGSWSGFAIYAPYPSGGTGAYTVRINNRSVGTDSSTFDYDTPHVLIGYRNSDSYPVLIVDGSTYTGTTTAAIPNQGMNLFLFTRNPQSGGTVSGSPTGLKIYYAKIWSGNNLIRSYIPVLHWIGGQYTPCFYDNVNDNYIYNSGTDTPIYKM